MILTVDETIDRYADHIYRAALSYLKDTHDAEDVVNDVLMKYFSACEKLDIESEEHLKAWLLRTAINRCKDILGSARKKHETKLEDIHDPKADNCDTLLDVRQAVNALDDKYRIVVYLYYYEEYGTKEIAGILGLPKGTVVSRLKRARDMLRKKLNGYERE